MPAPAFFVPCILDTWALKHFYSSSQSEGTLFTQTKSMVIPLTVIECGLLHVHAKERQC